MFLEKSMYLNKLKIASSKVLYNILIWSGIFLAFFTVLCLFATFGELYKGRIYLIAGCFMMGLFGSISALLITIPLSAKARLYRAEKYNRIFEEDYDGMVPYSAFMKLTGFSGSRVRNDIRILTEKNILRNITYGYEGAMVIMKPDTEGDFISVDCPNCGAAVSMRVTGGARCEHCGTYLRSSSK